MRRYRQRARDGFVGSIVTIGGIIVMEVSLISYLGKTNEIADDSIEAAQQASVSANNLSKTRAASLNTNSAVNTTHIANHATFAGSLSSLVSSMIGQVVASVRCAIPFPPAPEYCAASAKLSEKLVDLAQEIIGGVGSVRETFQNVMTLMRTMQSQAPQMIESAQGLALDQLEEATGGMVSDAFSAFLGRQSLPELADGLSPWQDAALEVTSQAYEKYHVESYRGAIEAYKVAREAIQGNPSISARDASVIQPQNIVRSVELAEREIIEVFKDTSVESFEYDLPGDLSQPRGLPVALSNTLTEVLLPVVRNETVARLASTLGGLIDPAGPTFAKPLLAWIPSLGAIFTPLQAVALPLPRQSHASCENTEADKVAASVIVREVDFEHFLRVEEIVPRKGGMAAKLRERLMGASRVTPKQAAVFFVGALTDTISGGVTSGCNYESRWSSTPTVNQCVDHSLWEAACRERADAETCSATLGPLRCAAHTMCD